MNRRLFLLGLAGSALLAGGCAWLDKPDPMEKPTSEILPEPGGVSGQGISYVILHGKGGRIDAPPLHKLAEELQRAGHRVVMPTMPWAKESFSAKFEEGIRQIGEAVAEAAKGNKKVVLIGHSLGGAAVIHYGAGSPSQAVVALVVIAPGHFPHITVKFQSGVQASLTKAREMVRSGKGSVVTTFTDFNQGGERKVYASAETFLSYLDLEHHPDVLGELGQLKRPLLWIGGQQDPLTSQVDYASRYETMQKSSAHKGQNRFSILDGDHMGVLLQSAPPIREWLFQVIAK